MHLTDSLDAFLLISCLFALPVLLTCKSEAGRVPGQLTFAFGDEYSLTKRGDYMAINFSPRWRDTQIPPPDDFDETASSVLITSEEFDTLWRQLQAIDVQKLHDPEKLAFTKTPPGMSSREILRYLVDNDTIANWTRSYQKLDTPQRAPLDGVVRILTEMFARRSGEVVLPEDFSLSFGEAGAVPNRVQFASGTAQLVVAGTTRDVSASAFQEFWRKLLELRLLNREFLTFDPTHSEAARFDLTLRVNGAELQNGQFLALETDAPTFRALQQAVDALAGK